ncbi:vacuolar protein sorting-associated protein 13 family protein [Pelomyxa schiedti]|nr:vacuolar protein sorting-associated protein 13 family protein [Pelomyxa schiedti]
MANALVRDLFVGVMRQFFVVDEALNSSLSSASGDLCFENMNVAPSALNALELPLCVHNGTLQKMQLLIPWNKLFLEPVHVKASGLHVTLGPPPDLSEKEEQERYLREKRHTLDKFEKSLQQGTVFVDKPSFTGSFLEKLIDKLLSNVQIYIEDVNICYKDTNDNTLFLGFSLDHVAIQSTGPDWISHSNCISGPKYKLVDLTGLRFYGPPQVFALFHFTNENSFQVVWNTVSTRSTPKISLQSSCDEITVCVGHTQWISITKLIQKFTHYPCKQFAAQKPKVSPKEDPKAWWKYAGNYVLNEYRKQHWHLSWATLAERRDTRKEYIHLYKKSKLHGGQSSLSEEEKTHLAALDERLDISDIILYRSIVMSEIVASHIGVHSPSQSRTPGLLDALCLPKFLSSKLVGGNLEATLTSEALENICTEFGYQHTKTMTEMYFGLKLQIKQITLSLRDGGANIVQSKISGFDFSVLSSCKKIFSMSLCIESGEIMDSSTTDPMFRHIFSSSTSTRPLLLLDFERAEENSNQFQMSLNIQKEFEVCLPFPFLQKIVTFFPLPYSLCCAKGALTNVKSMLGLNSTSPLVTQVFQITTVGASLTIPLGPNHPDTVFLVLSIDSFTMHPQNPGYQLAIGGITAYLQGIKTEQQYKVIQPFGFDVSITTDISDKTLPKIVVKAGIPHMNILVASETLVHIKLLKSKLSDFISLVTGQVNPLKLPVNFQSSERPIIDFFHTETDLIAKLVANLSCELISLTVSEHGTPLAKIFFYNLGTQLETNTHFSFCHLLIKLSNIDAVDCTAESKGLKNPFIITTAPPVPMEPFLTIEVIPKTDATHMKALIHPLLFRINPENFSSLISMFTKMWLSGLSNITGSFLMYLLGPKLQIDATVTRLGVIVNNKLDKDLEFSLECTVLQIRKNRDSLMLQGTTQCLSLLDYQSLEEPPVSVLIHIITTGPLIQQYISGKQISKTTGTVEPKDNKPKFSAHVTVQAPEIIIPKYTGSKDSLIIELGTLSLTNSLTPTFHKLSASVEHMSMRTIIHNSPASVIEGLHFTLTIETRGQSDADNPFKKIVVVLSPIYCHVSEVQYLFFVSQWTPMLQGLKKFLLSNTDMARIVTAALSQANSGTHKDYGENFNLAEFQQMEKGNVEFQLNLDVPKISFALLRRNGSSKASDLLATYEIINMSMKVSKTVEHFICVGAVIQAIQFSDSREDSHCALQDYFSCQNETSALTVEFIQELKTGVRACSILLDSPTFVVLPSMLSEVKAFASKAHLIKNQILSEPERTLDSPKLTSEATDPNPFPAIYFMFTVNNLEVIFLQDETNCDSQCISFHASAIIKTCGDLRHILKTFDMQINQADMVVFRLFAGKREAKSRTSNVLKPVDCHVKYTRTPAINEGLVSLEPVELYFSYMDLVLMTQVFESLQSTVFPTYRKPIKAVQSAMRSYHLQTHSTTSREFTVKCVYCCLTIINDFKGRDTPLFELRANNVLSRVTDWDTYPQFSSELLLAIDFFNNNLMCYEPFVEHYFFKFKFGRTPQCKLMCLIESPEVLNINFSQAMVSIFVSTIFTLVEDYYNRLFSAQYSEVATTSSNFHPLNILNKTGVSCSYFAPHSDDVESPPELVLTQDKILPLSQCGTSMKAGRNLITGYQLATVVVGAFTQKEINIDRLGIEGRPLPDSSWLISEVKWTDDGSKLLVLRSSVMLRNCTTMEIAVCLRNTTGKSELILAPDEESPIPLQFSSRGLVSARNSAKFRYFEPQLKIESLKPHNYLVVIVEQEEKISKGLLPFYLSTITFYAPITIVNALPYPFSVAGPEDSGLCFTVESDSCKPIFDHNVNYNLVLRISGLPGFKETKLKLKTRQCSINHTEKLLFCDKFDQKMPIFIDVNCDKGLVLTFYSPCWIINNSELPIWCQPVPCRSGLCAPGQVSALSTSPLLYSEKKLALRTQDGLHWSKGFSVESLGVGGVVQILGHVGHAYTLKVTVQPGLGSFYRTKIVTLFSQFMLSNAMALPLLWSQPCTHGNTHTGVILPGEKQPFHFMQTGPKVLSIKADARNTLWSGVFSISHVGEFSVKCRSEKSTAEDYYIHVEVNDDSECTSVLLSEQNPETPNFVIENDTSLDLDFQQKKTTVDPLHLPTKTAAMYVWDEPLGDMNLLVSCEAVKSPLSFNIQKIKAFDVVNIKGIAPIYPFVKMEGVTRVFVLTHTNARYNSDTADEPKKTGEVRNFTISVQLAGLGISVISKTPKEILFCSLSRIHCAVEALPREFEFELQVAALQVDNQDPEAEFPVFCEVNSISYPCTNKIDYFSYFSILLQEMELNIETHFIDSILQFYQSLPFQDIRGISPQQSSFLTAPKMIYFKLLFLQPIKVYLTLSWSSDTHLGIKNNPLIAVFQTVSSAVANVDHAPIIGSSDLLGNPVGLFTNLSTGVMDFFYEPAQGLVTSPQAFGVGLAKGSKSLVKNTVYGLFNSLSKVTGALGKGVAALSMDDDYLAKRRVNRKKKPKNIGDGTVQGVKQLGSGVLLGITGVVNKPVAGAAKGGAIGFAKGVGQGIVGVAVKPVAGIFDLASQTTAGIGNTALLLDKKVHEGRIRKFPRLFGPNGQLLEYHEIEAEGAALLLQTKFSNTDTYVHHTIVSKARMVLLTSNRLLVLSVPSHSVLEQIPYTDVAQWDLVEGGIKVFLKKGETIILAATDPAILMLLYTKIIACARGFSGLVVKKS